MDELITKPVVEETITVSDDGAKSKDEVKVVVKTTETKEVVDIQFEGTLSDIVNETLPRLYNERDITLAEIAKFEALRDKIQAEVDKLPAR